MLENQEEKRIAQARTIINGFANSLLRLKVDNSISEVVDCFKLCKGKIVTTGMGKAGIAMRKFTATLCSLGIPSCFLHPGEASHGDLGVISANDILFVASTSGKTREILEVIELSKKINVSKTIGITSHEDSPIKEIVDIVIDIGIIREEGELGLAPTTSILAILAITDAIALITSSENGFSRENYGKLHHSGYLGKISKSIKG